jgi:hypothetical protein
MADTCFWRPQGIGTDVIYAASIGRIRITSPTRAPRRSGNYLHQRLMRRAYEQFDDEGGGENHSTARRTGAHRASGETDSVGSSARSCICEPPEAAHGDGCRPPLIFRGRRFMKTADGREIYGMGGGAIENFREGWAILPFVGGHCKPHYWKRIELSNHYIALCGLSGSLATKEMLVARGMPHAQAIKPHAPGDFMDARCAHCRRIRQRQTRFSVTL